MKKGCIISDKHVALRKKPWNNELDSVIMYLEPGTIIYVSDDFCYDLMGEKKYLKISSYSGKEGYVLADAIKEV